MPEDIEIGRDKRPVYMPTGQQLKAPMLRMQLSVAPGNMSKNPKA